MSEVSGAVITPVSGGERRGDHPGERPRVSVTDDRERVSVPPVSGPAAHRPMSPEAYEQLLAADQSVAGMRWQSVAARRRPVTTTRSSSVPRALVVPAAIVTIGGTGWACGTWQSFLPLLVVAGTGVVIVLVVGVASLASRLADAAAGGDVR